MSEGTVTSVGTKLYADQKKAWDAARGNLGSSDALREAMQMYCQSKGIDFPLYETGGRGGARIGDEKIEVKRKD